MRQHLLRVVRTVAVLLLISSGLVRAAEYTTPIYGVVAATDMDPTSAAWFSTANPAVFQQLVVGQVAYTSSQPSSPFTLGIYHAHLLPQVAATPTGFAITGYQTDRIESVSMLSGSLQTTVLLTLSPTLPVAANSTGMFVYIIQGQTVDGATLTNGFQFPTAVDGTNYRWTETGLNMRGTTDGTWLIGGSASIELLTQATQTALSSYPGAYVQLQDTASGQYRYVLQSQITPSNPSLYDPVLDNGGLILGGTSTVMSGSAGTASASYTLETTVNTGTFNLSSAVLNQQLPASIQPAAAASEQPVTVNTSPPVINTSQQRGTIPEVDSNGVPTGQIVQLYSSHATPQTTVQVLTDIGTQSSNATSAAPVDTMASSSSPDRINTPVTGTGASGLTQVQAQQQAASWNYLGATTTTGTDTTATLTYGQNPDGTPAAETIDANAILQSQDEELNNEVATTYTATGAAIAPQAVPLVINATGTIAQAQAAGAPDETYASVDVVNTLMAPQMEDTTWPGGYTPQYHHAMIYPVDYVDQWMVNRYGPYTGVTIPDQQGNPIPGDGINPYAPIPLGCAAGHPFYDLNGDGSLDRWYSDDPFDGGYQKMKVMWYEEPGGSQQLGSFSANPSYNVCVIGIHNPTQASPGVWTTAEDLLFTVGHNFKPFDHESFTLTGFKTYYDGGMITPLDPIDPTDPTLYQLSVRNLTTIAPPATPPVDGATPQQMAPTVVSGMQPESLDLLGTGVPQSYTLYYTIDWYDQLASFIQTPPWSWAWSNASFTLPTGVVNHVGSPAVFNGTLVDATGATVQTSQVSCPMYTDPVTHQVSAFTPALIPINNSPPAPQTPIADTYMWNYPVGLSTAEGGTQQADPLNWLFPWNLPWNGDQHSKNMSAQAFTLNSANMSYFPDYATFTPVISHASLLAASGGTTPIVVQWLLRENTAPNPTGLVSDWVDGQILYTQPGYAPPAPWIDAGRSLFHVFGWDPRTDAWSSGRQIGGCTMPSGTRVFDVVAGYATYLFRGSQYVCKTQAEQIAMLQRMWNYYMTGYEYPAANVTTLPSLCIPQRLDNSNLTSPLLNTVQVPLSSTGPDVSANRADANQGGDVSGNLVADLASPALPRYREQTERRIRLMNEQIFLFSAARGREWELQMARRMPQSVRLVCVEYDDKEAVKAILGVNGGNVYFPNVQTTTYTDNMGATHSVQISNETDVLREIAEKWLDGLAPEVCYESGQMGINGDYSIHTSTPSNNQNQLTGSGSTISPAAFSSYNGFAAMLPEGIPEGFALYAFPLRSLPQYSQQQWAPDPGQPIYSNVAIEFRHPMLLMYHDGASAIYVHYGRNADPDTVFGNWNSCAPPPANLSVTSAEYLRRQAFDAYATTPVLAHIYDLLNPAGYANSLASQVSLPPAPPDPGAQPTAPTEVPYPGPEPQAPTPPWAGLPGYAGLTLQEQETQYLDSVPEPGQIPPLDWIVGYGDDVDIASNGTGAPAGPVNQDASNLIDITDLDADGVTPSAWAPILDGSFTYYTSFTWDGPTNTLGGWDYFDDNGALFINGQEIDARSWTNGAGSLSYTFEDGQTYEIWLNFNGYGPPNTIDIGFANPDYDNWPQVQAQLQQQVDTYNSQLTAFQAADAVWQIDEAAYLQYLAASAAYQSAYTVWSSEEGAWNQWNSDNQALIADQEAAQQFLANQQVWISLVLAQTSGPSSSYAGDPTCQLTTLAQFQAIQPQLPIWQAYAWFVDPANGVTQALPTAPAPAPAP